ncbi:MAG: tryptophan 7-halogenase [Verrucomicrobiae bacterium]|nr:tryptophan 7-halogenase [Verrucomicrobiae bacterium]
MAPASHTYDVVIIGGGPGGSTAGALLAQAGKKVLILEKETFPRFHVGESLIPYGNDILKELGVWEKIEKAGFMPKWGAEFCLGNGSKFQQFWFGNSLGECYAKTFQVDRSRFDKILLEHAESFGCEIQQKAQATRVEFHDDYVNLDYNDEKGSHHITSHWLIDASGRDSFLGKQLQLPKRETQSSKRIAIFAHFENVFRNEGKAAGHITIVRLANGWFWFIPLTETKTSVGYIQALNDFKENRLQPEESFQQIIQKEKELQMRLHQAKRVGEFHVTSDYSYRFISFAQPRALMIGDAAGFVDPIFSSGVMMALKSAQLAVKTLLKVDAKKSALSTASQQKYTHQVRHMMEVYVDMINAFYDQDAFEVFMHPTSRLQLLRAVLAVLGGHTDFSFAFWWRLKLFYFLGRLQRFFPLVPRLNFSRTATS